MTVSPARTRTAPTAPRVNAPKLSLSSRWADELPELATPWEPATIDPRVRVGDPQLVTLTRSLATELGLDADALADGDGVAVLAAAAVPAGARPVATGYAGHQFGSWSPRLGDGRALLLGELTTAEGGLVDLHLKGSGRTPWARGGDGRATLASMLREVLIAEAMHALGVPTTRSLAVATTGGTVRREDGVHAGAVLTRVAASHIRIGTFQYAASLREPGLLARLVDHAAARHHPHVVDLDPAERPLALLDAVVGVQASLVARWLGLGFIHGVLNTDNVTISGETIDYGPCAFLDVYDPTTVFSSIDHGGRYSFGNQSRITHWNLVRLAESLLPLLAPDEQDIPAATEALTEVIATFPDRHTAAWTDEHRRKLGLVEARDEDAGLAASLLDGLHAARADLTGAYRALSASLRGDEDDWSAIAIVDPLIDWRQRLDQRLADEGRDPADAADAMDAANPVHIPRNHLVEKALEAARTGDLSPFESLLEVVTDPFSVRPDEPRWAAPAPAAFTAQHVTYCGT